MSDKDRPDPDDVGATGIRPWLEDHGKIAAGGMSYIHKVHNRNLRRKTAMKVLKKEFSAEGTSRERFLEEAQITGQLDHPNIPPVYDLWVDGEGHVRFTMKLVKGKTLSEILEGQTPGGRSDHALEELLEIFLKVCDAVSFAHSHGVIHRDLKPDNIMVGTHGQVWVMDWGCAFIQHRAEPGEEGGVSVNRDPATESLDPPDTAIGTASYMSPEQAHARMDQINQRTDVYLLGGVLYEILSGRPPHDTDNIVASILKAQDGRVDDPRKLVGEGILPPELCRITMRALAARQEDRYSTVADFKDEIESSLKSGWWFATATFPPDTLVVMEGDVADAAYIIRRGHCEAFRMEGGKRVFLRRMGPGDTFGETAIFTSQQRTASVETADEVTATIVTPESFERAMGGTPWIRPFVQALAERFQELDTRLSYLRTDD